MLQAVRYNGGKGGAGVAQWIIRQMPRHRVYVEAFLGGGSVMRLKKSAAVNIGIDADGRALSAFRREFTRCDLVEADAIGWLRAYDWRGDELVYADPPYPMAVRSWKRRLYRCELSDGGHVELLALLKCLPCMVMISGYRSPLYASSLRAWRSTEFGTVKRNGKRSTECLWMNFEQKPGDVHDLRFVGENFRERDRIRRKIGRWKSRLLSLPAGERAALLEAISLEQRQE